MNFNFLHLIISVFLVFPVSSEEIFFNNHNIHGEDSTFKDFIKWQLSGNKPDRFSIEMSDEFNLLLKKPKTPYAVWVGHSNFLINNNDINILTDPIFSKRASPISFAGPKRLIPPGINFNLLPDIDVVTVSHAHYDHMDIPTLKRLYEINENTLFLVPMNSAKLLLSAGIKNVVEMNWWDTISLSDTLITFVPVHHWSSRTPFDKNEKKQMVDSDIAANIPISGRPLKDIFADILITANKNSKLNLQNYRERIYTANEEQTQLIQGALEWEVESEDFSILKLTRGNVGSRSHFVLHLAKRTNLNSKPGFPAPKSGLCKSTLLFKRGKNEMRNSSKPALNKLAKCLRKYPKQIIKITGHTDPLKPNYGEGSKYSNVTLGLKRAEALMKSLIAMEFNSGRFIVVSKGSMDPVAIGRDNKELEKNRRVEVVSSPNE